MKLAFRRGETWRRWGSRRLLLLAAALVAAAGVNAQVRPDSVAARQKHAAPLRHAVSVTGGYSWPLSREGITEFWDSGPAASISFSVTVNRSVSVGLGLELAKFRFNPSRFADAYPGVEPQQDDVLWTSVFVGGRYAFLPGMRTNPYIGCSVGASRLTEALHRVIVDEVRTTYYSVGGTTRLTACAAAGTDIFFNRSLAFELEIRGLAVHNDPDLGFAVSAHAGLRFAF